MDLAVYLNKRTLILGDVNAGKTTFCKNILDAMQRAGLSWRIAVIDFAPEIFGTEQDLSDLKGVGGQLLATNREGMAWLSDSFVPPRLSSKDEQEALQKARENAAKGLTLFKCYAELKRDILFINDISIFLQVESAQRVMDLTQSAKTIVANGYYGGKLGAGALSLRERREMESLRRHFDNIILL